MAFGSGNSVSMREKDKDKKANRRGKGDDPRKLENDPNTTPLIDVPGKPGSAMIEGDHSMGNSVPHNATPHRKEREAGGWTQILEDWFVRGIRRTVDEVRDDEAYQSQSQFPEWEAAPFTDVETSPESISQRRLARAPSESVAQKLDHSLNLLNSAAVQGSPLSACACPKFILCPNPCNCRAKCTHWIVCPSRERTNDGHLSGCVCSS